MSPNFHRLGRSALVIAASVTLLGIPARVSAEPVEQAIHLPILISVRGARVTGRTMAISAVIPGATPRGTCYYMFDMGPTRLGEWSTTIQTASPAIAGGCRTWRFRVPSTASTQALHVAARAEVSYYDGAGWPIYATSAEWRFTIWRRATSRFPAGNLAMALVDFPSVRVMHVGQSLTATGRRTRGLPGVYLNAFRPDDPAAAAVWDYGTSTASITVVLDKPGVWTIEASSQTSHFDPVTDDERVVVLP